MRHSKMALVTHNLQFNPKKAYANTLAALPEHAQHHSSSPLQQHSQHSAWSAFLDGMKVLQKYAVHSENNAKTISKSNLQLLHRTLLTDASYSKTVQQALSSSSPQRYCVFESQTLHAEVIVLQKGASIRLPTHQNRQSLLLSISGKPQLNPIQPLQTMHSVWWSMSHLKNQNASLKNNDVVIVFDAEQTLTAYNNACVLLRVEWLFEAL
jgi:tRNA(Leu) C34 or U34 (ribose-2'-O)-methylase TrmL